MRKEKLLWLVLTVMVVLNLVTLSFLLFDSKNEPIGKKKFDAMVEKKLYLTPEQKEAFDDMKHGHHRQMKQLDKEMKQLFEAYFNLLAENNVDEEKKDSLEKVLNAMYTQKIRITFQHFNELKTICTPEQKEEFPKIVPMLMQVITSPPPKRMEPHEGFEK